MGSPPILHLGAQGVQVSGGTIVDATIIDAPTSTKNREGKRARKRLIGRSNKPEGRVEA